MPNLAYTAPRDGTEIAAPTARRVLYGIGEAVFTIGAIVSIFAGYAFFGQAWQIDHAQRGLNDKLDRLWSAGADPVPGQPAGRLYIPRLHKRWVVVEGVSQAALAKGPGHYPKSDDPGEVGNLAIAGHRITSVFW